MGIRLSLEHLGKSRNAADAARQRQLELGRDVDVNVDVDVDVRSLQLSC